MNNDRRIGLMYYMIGGFIIVESCLLFFFPQCYPPDLQLLYEILAGVHILILLAAFGFAFNAIWFPPFIPGAVSQTRKARVGCLACLGGMILFSLLFIEPLLSFGFFAAVLLPVIELSLCLRLYLLLFPHKSAENGNRPT